LAGEKPGTRCSWDWDWDLFGCWQGVYRTNKPTMAWGIGWGIAKVGGTDITATVAYGKSLHCTERVDIGGLALKSTNRYFRTLSKNVFLHNLKKHNIIISALVSGYNT